jgi:hypothetical protein
VHVEEAVQLGDHVGERPGLVAVAGLEGVAVHRVADPGDLRPSRHLGHDVGQHLADPTGPHPGDEGDPAGVVVGSSRSASSQAVSGVVFGPSLTPIGLRT